MRFTVAVWLDATKPASCSRADIFRRAQWGRLRRHPSNRSWQSRPRASTDSAINAFSCPHSEIRTRVRCTAAVGIERPGPATHLAREVPVRPVSGIPGRSRRNSSKRAAKVAVASCCASCSSHYFRFLQAFRLSELLVATVQLAEAQRQHRAGLLNRPMPVEALGKDSGHAQPYAHDWAGTCPLPPPHNVWGRRWLSMAWWAVRGLASSSGSSILQ